jgi:hypothetical protein
MQHTHPGHLINHFPSREIVAARIGATKGRVHKWAQFDRNQAEHQQGVVLAAQSLGLSHGVRRARTRIEVQP